MEQRTVKLTLEKAKEWYKQGGELKEVALQAYKEDELKDYRSHSWEEFCERNLTTDAEYYIDDSSLITRSTPFNRSCESDKNVYPTKKYAVAALALTQLLQLRNEWIEDWEPDYYQDSQWCIILLRTGDITITKVNYPRILSFPTQDMISDFCHDFKDLLEIAKPLL